MENENLHSLIFSDKPTKDDQLNFRDYAGILADIAMTSETPTTIGIFGEWGSGKSSLMMMVDEILQDQNVHTIWFNSWKYDKEDALWRSLILRIMEGLDAKDSEVEEIRRKLYTAISTEELGKTQINWTEVGKTFTKEGIKAVATVAFPLTGVGTIFANLGKSILNTNSIDEISKAVTRQTIQKNQDRISSIEEFDKLYSDLIVKLLGKNDRLIVFIDDLDRCSPLQALLVLESLKSFLAAERCVYVVACDPRLIQKGFEKKYGAGVDQDVSDYLEKIVQIYFEIPPLRVEDTENFLAKLGIGDEAKTITQIVMSSLESNPRKLKRFLNNVEIQHRLILTRKLGIEKDILIKLVRGAKRVVEGKKPA
jgi:predicted KAP-like P-loop ATPase